VALVGGTPCSVIAAAAFDDDPPGDGEVAGVVGVLLPDAGVPVVDAALLVGVLLPVAAAVAVVACWVPAQPWKSNAMMSNPVPRNSFTDRPISCIGLPRSTSAFNCARESLATCRRLRTGRE
jgi:hypothetical protein